ncbi:unnamed protein product [Caenorhabditis nigoni]
MKHSTLIWPGGDSAVGMTIHSFYFVIIFIGLVLNIYVVFRMRKFCRTDKDQFLNGTGLYLMSMACCDAVNLVLSSVEMITYLLPVAASEETAHILCKVSKRI